MRRSHHVRQLFDKPVEARYVKDVLAGLATLTACVALLLLLLIVLPSGF
jgi:hypothetical protein